MREASDKPDYSFGYIVDERPYGIRADLAELNTLTRWLFSLVFATLVGVIAQSLLS